MVNTYSQNTKKDCHKKHMEDIKIFLKKKTTKGKKRPEKDFLFIFLSLIPETWEMKFYHQYLEADIYLKDCL